MGGMVIELSTAPVCQIHLSGEKHIDAGHGLTENAASCRIPQRILYKCSIRIYEISICLNAVSGGTPPVCGLLLPSRDSGGGFFL
jgi:hypothetical protein